MPGAGSEDSARKRALRLLAAGPRTVAELRQRLAKAGVSEGHVQAIVGDLMRLGYLDDRAYALSRAKSLFAGGKNGPRGVLSKLTAKGVAPDVARRAMEEALAEESEDQLARRALASRPHGKLVGEKDNGRAARFLLRRGFSAATVARVIGIGDEFDLSET
jgi:regulatory protein